MAIYEKSAKLLFRDMIKRACPPEDCGGIWGYSGFLEAIEDVNHPEHDNMLEWIGGEFDSKKFDVESINRELKDI